MSLDAIVEAEYRLWGWPETDGRHDAPDLIADFVPRLVKGSHVPIDVFKPARQVQGGVVPAQHFPVQDRLDNVQKPAVLFAPVLLCISVGDIHLYPGPFTCKIGVQLWQRVVVINGIDIDPSFFVQINSILYAF